MALTKTDERLHKQNGMVPQEGDRKLAEAGHDEGKKWLVQEQRQQVQA